MRRRDFPHRPRGRCRSRSAGEEGNRARWTTTSTIGLSMKLAQVGEPFPFGASEGPDERQGDTEIEDGS
jgi:hypothetical protein